MVRAEGRFDGSIRISLGRETRERPLLASDLLLDLVPALIVILLPALVDATSCSH